MMNFIANNAGLIGLLFFFTIFVGVAIWSFRPSKKSQIESYKHIPIRNK